jgi:molybdopterin-binding protein
MNELKAIVSNIQSVGSLNIVQFDYTGIILTMMGLELPNIKIGSKVILSVKPTHIAIAKDFEGNISLSNIIKAKIKELNNGKLLSSMVLKIKEQTTMQSIITYNSSKRMDLKVADEVVMLIKASDLFIKEVL